MTALMHAALYGKLGCLEHLIAKGANLEAASTVSTTPPAAPHPLCPSPSVLAARCPALMPSLTACGAAAAPPFRPDGPHGGG